MDIRKTALSDKSIVGDCKKICRAYRISTRLCMVLIVYATVLQQRQRPLALKNVIL